MDGPRDLVFLARLVWYGPGGLDTPARWDEYGLDDKRLPGATNSC